MSMRLVLGIVALAALIPDEAAPRERPRVRLTPDVGVSLGAGTAWLGLHFLHPSLARTGCPCEPDDVNAFDRPAVEMSFHSGEILGSVVGGVVVAAPFFVLSQTARDRKTLIEDSVLVGESALFAGLLTATAKVIASRPYPYMYGPAPYPEQNSDGQNYASFWSGHSAVPMAAVVTLGLLLERYEPRPKWRWLVWTVGPALALGAGLLEMSAGNHFPSDVAVGAAAGAAIGGANFWIHTF